MNRREELIDVQCQIESLSTQVRQNQIRHVCVVLDVCFYVYEQNTQKIWLRHIAWSGITIDNGVIILSRIRPPNAQAGHFHIDLCNLVIIMCIDTHRMHEFTNCMINMLGLLRSVTRECLCPDCGSHFCFFAWPIITNKYHDHNLLTNSPFNCLIIHKRNISNQFICQQRKNEIHKKIAIPAASDLPAMAVPRNTQCHEPLAVPWRCFHSAETTWRRASPGVRYPKAREEIENSAF